MENLTGAQWKAKYGEGLLKAGMSPERLDLCAAGIDERRAEREAARKFWATATYEEKERELIQQLAHARCDASRPKHNPNRCNSCGPIHAALRMLKEGKL